MSYFEDNTKYEGLESCVKPKLFFAGTHDVLVTPEDVRESFEIAAEPKQFHELDAEHDYRLLPEIIREVNEVTAKFLTV